MLSFSNPELVNALSIVWMFSTVDYYVIIPDFNRYPRYEPRVPHC
jgi:hypothetical protein